MFTKELHLRGLRPRIVKKNGQVKLTQKLGDGNQYEGPFKIPLLTQTIVASDSKQLSVFDLKNVSLSKSISFENNFPLGLDKHKNRAENV